ncbi:MAG: CpsD/CapB family tyrosine-protein kinase [Oscillospiraceae bacterium]
MFLNKRKNDFLNKANPDFVILNSAPFAVKEAYKAVRTNINFSIGASECKVIIVTSSNSSEGKSTTSVNLAITMAQTESKVLLIDGDLRKPTIHKLLRLNNNTGLSDTLIGLGRLEDAINKNYFANLSVITSGTIPPNPTELLSSKAMTNLIEKVCQSYDYIIIDTPPVNIVTDALVLMNEKTGAILVCRQAETTHEEFKKSSEKIKSINTNVLGAIMTYSKSQKSYYGGKYRYKDKY